MNDPKKLYEVYAAWTGQLHFWVEHQLGRHIDCEFFPDPDWRFGIYTGHAEVAGHNVMNFVRPMGERRAVLQLPRPEDDPNQQVLDATFREICLKAADLLSINVSKATLKARGDSPQRLPPPSEAPESRRPKRVRSRHPAKSRQSPPAKD